MAGINNGKTDAEYGAGRGTPARFPDGSSRRIETRVQTVGEAARVARIVRKKDVPSNTEPRRQITTGVVDGKEAEISNAPFAPDVNAIAEIRRKTNSYSDESDGYSEQVQ